MIPKQTALAPILVPGMANAVNVLLITERTVKYQGVSFLRQEKRPMTVRLSIFIATISKTDNHLIFDQRELTAKDKNTPAGGGGKMHKRELIVIGIVLALTLGLFFLTKLARVVEVKASTNLAWLHSALIAHRGLHDNNQEIPENSMAAFKGAIEKGYIIELDVAMTKDGKLVVYHDKKLRRGLGVDQYLHELTYDELTKYKLFGSTETVPLFSQVLTMVAGRVPLLIEIKNEGKVGDLESLLYEKLQSYQGQYAIQSFNPFTLQWFRQNAPEILRGQLAGSFEVSDYDVEFAGTTRLPWYKRLVLENMLLNFISRPQFISYEINNTSTARLKTLKRMGVPLLGWTVKTKAEYLEAKEIFDNLIVDAVLKSLFP